MNRPHFRRRPRPTDPEPEYSRLDRLDGLGTRYDAVLDSGPTDGTATRYDAELSSVLAAEAPGGDLAAMAAPWPGMARDDLGTYAEADGEGYPLYRVGPDGIVTVSEPDTYVDLADFGLSDAERADAVERIMADLASLDRELDAFADGRAYETGTRCRTDSAALRRATEHLADGQDGARRAALVLAGFTGAEAWAV